MVISFHQCLKGHSCLVQNVPDTFKMLTSVSADTTHTNSLLCSFFPLFRRPYPDKEQFYLLKHSPVTQWEPNQQNDNEAQNQNCLQIVQPQLDIPFIPRFILEFASLHFGNASHTTDELLAVAHFIAGSIRGCRETGSKEGRGLEDGSSLITFSVFLTAVVISFSKSSLLQVRTFLES